MMLLKTARLAAKFTLVLEKTHLRKAPNALPAAAMRLATARPYLERVLLRHILTARACKRRSGWDWLGIPLKPRLRTDRTPLVHGLPFLARKNGTIPRQ